MKYSRIYLSNKVLTIPNNRSLIRFKRVVAAATAVRTLLPQKCKELDSVLSNRKIELDPEGYFIIKVNREKQQLIAELYDNSINDRGLACDPETGEVIACRKGQVRYPKVIFEGSSAKDLCVKVVEESGLKLMQDHAAYLGREFQKAEFALIYEMEYEQD